MDVSGSVQRARRISAETSRNRSRSSFGQPRACRILIYSRRKSGNCVEVDENNWIVDPADRRFRYGYVLCRCVEAVLRRNTFMAYFGKALEAPKARDVVERILFGAAKMASDPRLP